MFDLVCVYSAKELDGLDEGAKATLQKELIKQVKASREIRAIIHAHEEANKTLKEKLRGTYGKLKKSPMKNVKRRASVGFRRKG